MDKTLLISRAKEMIADGNTDQAIELTEGFLSKKPTFKILHNEALHLASLYYKTKQEISKRTISFENSELNYGKVREGLLQLLDYIETDNFTPAGLLSSKPTFKQTLQANKWLFLIGVPLILLSVAVLLLVKNLGGNEQNPEECKVKFDNPSEKNFLIMPFYKPQGGEAQIEGLFTSRLEEFCAGIESLKNAGFAQCEGFEPRKLLNFEEAAQYGAENNATIVLWGLTEQGSDGTNFVKTRFKYLGGKDKDGKVPFTKLSESALQGEQSVSTDKVLSIITSSGELTQNIESTLMLMFGMIASLEGDREGAISAMKEADVKNDSTANLLKYMILADNYIAIGDSSKAKAALDTCLDLNKSYWLGRNNRANLRMQDGDYLGAIEDLTVALKKQPEDAEMLATRGWAFKQSQQLYAAKQDFEKAAKLNPKNERELKKEIEKTEIEIKRLERIVEPTKVNIDRTQFTKQQYITAASASNSLGDIATTKKLVTRGLEIDNANPKLIAIQVDNLLKQNDVAKAKEVLNAALKRNVKKEEIAKNSSNVAKLIREMSSKNELEIQ